MKIKSKTAIPADAPDNAANSTQANDLGSDPQILDSDVHAFNDPKTRRASSMLTQFDIYTRKDLKQLLSTEDSTINTGVFIPAGFSSILLFVTKEKTSDRTQYEDNLDGDFLYWQGQMKGRKDSIIAEHRGRNLELLVFYRIKKYEHAGAGFRFEGRFDYVSHEGREPANFVLAREEAGLVITGLAVEELVPEGFDPLDIEDARKRTLGAIVRRQGQPAFRRDVLRAYEGRCAVTGCRVVEVLEAAHIVGYRGVQTNHVTNGILLRADLHTLFDLGMVCVDQEYRFGISSILKNTEYEQWDDKIISLPKKISEYPSLMALKIHKEA